MKVAEDSDFYQLKRLVDDDADWKLEYEKGATTKVWTKQVINSNFKMVKVHTFFPNVTPNTLFDVLHDPEYRKEWDEHMVASIEIGYLNPNNDVGYYALSCPAPVKNRDFVLQRSWLDFGDEKLIFNHSVNHTLYPPKKGFVRAVSLITGFVVRPKDHGTFLGYITQTDPKGKLPSWLINKLTQKFAPKAIRKLEKAAEGYTNWKQLQPNPNFKPWIYPEQTLLSKRINVAECVNKSGTGDQDSEDE